LRAHAISDSDKVAAVVRAERSPARVSPARRKVVELRQAHFRVDRLAAGADDAEWFLS
jgi:hypothetical protein